MSNIFDTLVMDRPDINTYYNISDLNRVEEAVKQLAQRMTDEGYHVTPKAKTPTVVTEITDPKAPDKSSSGGTTGGIVEPYLQSSGTQYINTNFIPNNNTRVIIDVEFLTSSAAFVFGARSSTSFSLTTQGFGFRTDYGTTEKNINVTFVNKRFTIDKNKNVTTVGSLTATNNAETFSSGYPLALLAVNTSGSIGQYTSAKLYSCKVYDNGTLARDFIPKLDDNGVACLYDKVNDKYYYNAGTGSFTYGENVYSPVEYLESGGSQFINTGHKPTNKTDIEVELSDWAATETSTALWGCQTSSTDRYDMFISSGGAYRAYYYGSYVDVSGVSAKDKSVIKRTSNTITFNGVSATNTSATFTVGTSLFLFAHSSNGGGQKFAHLKMYACKMWEDGVLIRDFIPVVDSSGVGLLYDQLNGVPYYNAGSGSFTFKRLPGEVEYIESTGTQYILTGITGRTGLKVKAKYSINSNSMSDNHFLSSAGSGWANRCYLMSVSNSKYTYGYISEVTTNFALSANTPYEIEVNTNAGKQTAIINGATAMTNSNSASYNNGVQLSVFGLNVNGSVSNLSSGKIYYLAIYENDVLVRDFVPWVDESGTVCLKDKVSNSYYYNAGSGTFNAGAPVVEAPPEDEPEGDYIIPEIDIDPNIWNVYDIPTDTETARYINNLLVIRRQIAQNNTLALPNSMEGFNYNDANNIEIMLFAVNNLITQMIAQYRRCNTFKCGERR